MEEKDVYRHELKYQISYIDYLSLRSRLMAVMKKDRHVTEYGTYVIISIYFDNSDDKALKEKIDGVNKREKFRIRYYNDDHSFISLEKKMKINNLCQKFDVQISEDQCRKILDGDIDWMKDDENELIKEFYAKMKYQSLRPKVLVSYLREPYVYEAGNVRITFDSRIRTSMFHQKFLEDSVYDISATETPQDMIFEVKYDEFLPQVIQDLIQIKGIRQGAFSKYGACRIYG